MKWVNVLQGIFTVFTSFSFIYHLNKKKKKRKNSIQMSQSKGFQGFKYPPSMLLSDRNQSIDLHFTKFSEQLFYS